MQPRGQLWFALENICRDFRAYSGLTEKEALNVLIVVLSNMLADQQAELAKLDVGDSVDSDTKNKTGNDVTPPGEGFINEPMS